MVGIHDRNLKRDLNLCRTNVISTPPHLTLAEAVRHLIPPAMIHGICHKPHDPFGLLVPLRELRVGRHQTCAVFAERQVRVDGWIKDGSENVGGAHFRCWYGSCSDSVIPSTYRSCRGSPRTCHRCPQNKLYALRPSVAADERAVCAHCESMHPTMNANNSNNGEGKYARLAPPSTISHGRCRGLGNGLSHRWSCPLCSAEGTKRNFCAQNK